MLLAIIRVSVTMGRDGCMCQRKGGSTFFACIKALLCGCCVGANLQARCGQCCHAESLGGACTDEVMSASLQAPHHGIKVIVNAGVQRSAAAHGWTRWWGRASCLPRQGRMYGCQ